MNWLDFVIIAILVFFMVESIRHGFLVLLADFASFLVSLVFALRAYPWVADLLREKLSFTHSLSSAVGFLAVAIAAESILGFVFGWLVRRVPEKFHKGRLNRILSPLPALGEVFILVSFVLTLFITLPTSPRLKEIIINSKIGGRMVETTSGWETSINKIFGGVAEESLTYLTVRPGSEESVNLEIGSFKLSFDDAGEQELFRLVNEERKKSGQAELAWLEGALVPARNHAKDMWERKYFGHVSPEGKDVGDRLEEGGVNYSAAGENLALAPTVQTAHRGLMNSPGHRANILEAKFKKLAIGVVDNGVYGKMFVQVFTD